MPVGEEAVDQGGNQSQQAEAEPPDLVDEGPDEQEQAEEDFECQGCVEPRPGQPTQTQLEDHRVDHLPYRSWCPECVAGKATGE